MKKALALLVGSAVGAASFAQVALQNASATFSQAFSGNWNASEMIDGDFSGANGWAIFRNSGADRTLPEVAVLETVSDLTAPGISIKMTQFYGGNDGHLVGRYRWSYTTDDRADFADGLQNGGDVSANWTILTPSTVSATAGVSHTVLGDGSILMAFTSGTVGTAVYDLEFTTPVTGMTGLRIEVLDDPSLPTGGPGMFSNGNFVLTEVEVAAVPEPATLAALGAALAAVCRRRRNR